MNVLSELWKRLLIMHGWRDGNNLYFTLLRIKREVDLLNWIRINSFPELLKSLSRNSSYLNQTLSSSPEVWCRSKIDWLLLFVLKGQGDTPRRHSLRSWLNRVISPCSLGWSTPGRVPPSIRKRYLSLLLSPVEARNPKSRISPYRHFFDNLVVSSLFFEKSWMFAILISFMLIVLVFQPFKPKRNVQFRASTGSRYWGDASKGYEG